MNKEVNGPVTLVFVPDELNIVLKALEEQPYKIAAKVIMTIHTQVLASFDGPKPDSQPPSG